VFSYVKKCNLGFAWLSPCNKKWIHSVIEVHWQKWHPVQGYVSILVGYSTYNFIFSSFSLQSMLLLAWAKT
jgi:hypothetical protein